MMRFFKKIIVVTMSLCIALGSFNLQPINTFANTSDPMVWV